MTSLSAENQRLRMSFLLEVLGPGLIMVQVGSLVLFLLHVFYRGAYEARLQFIFCAFVFAAVLIARIAILAGSAHAGVYALALGIVTGAAVLRFIAPSAVLGPLLGNLANLSLLGLIWWWAHRITWDCTWLPENEDAAHWGLLGSQRTQDSPSSHSEQTLRRQSWQRRPGRWVLWFALAALPVFGLGCWYLPSPEAQTKAMTLMALFVASTLALLALTSYVGLWRYVVRRQGEVSRETGSTWAMATGVLLAVVLLGALLLPRPETVKPDLAAASRWLTSPLRTGDRWAPGPDEAPQGPHSSGNPSPHTRLNPSDQQPEKSFPEEQPHLDPSATDPLDGYNQHSQGSKSTPQSISGNQSSNSTTQDFSPSAPRKEQTQANPRQHSGTSAEELKHQQNKKSASSSSQPASQSPNLSGSSRRGEIDQSDAQFSQSPNSSFPRHRRDLRSRQHLTRTEEAPRHLSRQETVSPPGKTSSSFQLTGRNALVALGKLIKWIFYFLLIVALTWFLITRRKDLWRVIAGWLDTLRQWLHRIFGESEKPQGSKGIQENRLPEQPLPVRFEEFRNPFATSGRMSPQQIVIYTFSAVEAWAQAQGYPRARHEPPDGFLARVAHHHAAVAEHLTLLAGSYQDVVYGGRGISQPRLRVLAELWAYLERHARSTSQSSNFQEISTLGAKQPGGAGGE